MIVRPRPFGRLDKVAFNQRLHVYRMQKFASENNDLPASVSLKARPTCSRYSFRCFS
jgi:hypothetical protein